MECDDCASLGQNQFLQIFKNVNDSKKEMEFHRVKKEDETVTTFCSMNLQTILMKYSDKIRLVFLFIIDYLAYLQICSICLQS